MNASQRHSPPAASPTRWVPSLYFAMGLPFVTLNMVSAVMYKDMGVSDSQIAFWTSLVMWPWTLKFLWAPVLEVFGGRRLIVVATQVLSGVFFGCVALSLSAPHFFAVGVALMAAVAFSGATHDIAADGVYMAELSSRDQARYIGWQGAFYNLAKLVATGGLVWAVGWLQGRMETAAAWAVVMSALGALLLALGAWHARALPCGAGRRVRRACGGRGALGEVTASFFAKPRVWVYVGFIIAYRLGEGFVMKIVPLFLKSGAAEGGLGLTNREIGLYYGTFGAGAFLLGSLLAGYWVARRGLRRSLTALCCVFNLPFAVYALLAWLRPSSMLVVGGGIVVEYFGYGFGFVGLTLFMMQQVAPGPHQMAHYAFASGIMNLSVMLTGMASGALSDALGYRLFFTLVMGATVPALVMSRLVPFTHPDTPGPKEPHHE